MKIRHLLLSGTALIGAFAILNGVDFRAIGKLFQDAPAYCASGLATYQTLMHEKVSTAVGGRKLAEGLYSCSVSLNNPALAATIGSYTMEDQGNGQAIVRTTDNLLFPQAVPR